jgi:hypothetical protein
VAASSLGNAHRRETISSITRLQLGLVVTISVEYSIYQVGLEKKGVVGTSVCLIATSSTHKKHDSSVHCPPVPAAMLRYHCPLLPTDSIVVAKSEDESKYNRRRC